MSGMRALRLILAVLIAVPALRTVPAYSWHGSGSITALAIDPRMSTTVYAGTNQGVFQSTDGGANWSAAGLTNIFVTALGIDPRTPSDLPATLYAGTYDRGVFQSADGGANWSASGLTNIFVTALAIDPRTPSDHPATLYAGTYDRGVFKSTDGGTNWSPTGPTDLPNGWIQALAIDPLTPSTHPTTIYAVSPGAGVYKSTDGGATWNASLRTDWLWYQTATVQALGMDPLSPSTLYAAVYYVTSEMDWGEVLKSTDGGASWNGTGLNFHVIRLLAVDTRTPTAHVYAAGVDYLWGYDGVFKSTDEGTTWSAVNTGLTDTLSAYGLSNYYFGRVGSLVIDPSTPDTLYAGSVIGVFKSTDGGAHWSPTGLFQHSPLSSVSLNPDAVIGGTASTGTVTLVTTAPAGGVTVTLSSSNPTVATVPASVTVPAGATSASFTVSTSTLTVPAWATISAVFDDATRFASLYVSLPPPPTTLTSVSLNPTSVPGGTASTGTVTLNRAAPEGGAVVTLSSSNAAVATVPASVTVPAGGTNASFTVSTSAVAASTTVMIRAAYFNDLTVYLSVTPATTLSSVSLNPSSVTAGSTSTGTVILSTAAPAGGAMVSLASSNPAVATVPASVTVPAGATSANLTVLSGSVSGCSSAVAISGTYGGVTKSAVLTVTPAVTDTVTIQMADYFSSKRELRVAAKSTNSTAALRVYVTLTGELIGQLTNGGDGTFRGHLPWPGNPMNITVRSSSCGSATSAVRSK